MRILILGSVAIPVPPPAQGGTEWIVYHQAIGLAKRGHRITLVAAQGTARNFKETDVEVIEVRGGDVVTGAANQQRIDPVTTESSRKLRLEIVYLSGAAKVLIEHQDRYDVILNNMRGEGVFLPIALLLKKPFANVMHLNLFPELASLFSEYKTHVITISNAQRKDYPNLSYLGTVYNGVDVTGYPFNPTPRDYFLMVGSIGRHKNQKAAIAVAKKAGVKLILAGKIRDQDYFEEIKKDIDGEQIARFGEMPFDQKVKLYQEAKGFLFPILWEEPFGLVMIEAMSCGTPVIGFNHGAVAEVVEDGVTGYIVDRESGMVDAIAHIEHIDRQACRIRVEKMFTIERMIDRLEKALQPLM